MQINSWPKPKPPIAIVKTGEFYRDNKRNVKEFKLYLPRSIFNEAVKNGVFKESDEDNAG